MGTELVAMLLIQLNIKINKCTYSHTNTHVYILYIQYVCMYVCVYEYTFEWLCV